MSDILDQVQALLNTQGTTDVNQGGPQLAFQVETILKKSPFPPAGVRNMHSIPSDTREYWQVVGAQLGADLIAMAELVEELQACGCPACMARAVVLLPGMLRTSMAMGVLARRLEITDD